eukprot:2694613-Amphidinium_carterae.1
MQPQILQPPSSNGIACIPTTAAGSPGLAWESRASRCKLGPRRTGKPGLVWESCVSRSKLGPWLAEPPGLAWEACVSLSKLRSRRLSSPGLGRGSALLRRRRGASRPSQF